MVIALALTMIILGVAFGGIVQMQHRNATEHTKVDSVQQTRDFVDQMVRDVHIVGYPPPRVVNTTASCVTDPNTQCCLNNQNIACGIVSFSPTQIIYEGDLDGTGQVYRIWIQLQQPASGNCPCTLQRGVLAKASALAGNTPTYFTEVNGILNSGTGLGTATYPISLPGATVDYSAYSTADVFDAYDVNGDPALACADPVSCSSIHSLQITANVVSSFLDPKTNVFPVYSISSNARLNN